MLSCHGDRIAATGSVPAERSGHNRTVHGGTVCGVVRVAGQTFSAIGESMAMPGVAINILKVNTPLCNLGACLCESFSLYLVLAGHGDPANLFDSGSACPSSHAVDLSPRGTEAS